MIECGADVNIAEWRWGVEYGENEKTWEEEEINKSNSNKEFTTIL